MHMDDIPIANVTFRVLILSCCGREINLKNNTRRETSQKLLKLSLDKLLLKKCQNGT